MSREVRRVPLDFDAPMTTWHGYLRPEHLDLPQCQTCGGSGWNTASRWVQCLADLIAMLGDDNIDHQMRSPSREMHPYLATMMNRPINKDWFTIPRVSEDIHRFLAGLIGKDVDVMFGWHGQGWRVYRALVKAAKVGEDWGHCSGCAGEGTVATAEQQAAYDAWKPTPPPTGEGWQLWQTVSEGGPVSPVFATADELAVWLASPAAGSDQVQELAAARRVVQAGWAPSAIGKNGQVVTGTVWVGRETDPKRHADAS